MINSIQHFQQEGVKRLLKVFDNYGKDLSKMAEMVYGVTKEVTNLGCSMIAEEWESYDEILRQRKDLRKDWYIVRKDETTITTSLGDVTYGRTLFKNTKNGKSCYLLDKLLEIDPHTRMSEDAVARMLEEAADSSIWNRKVIFKNREAIRLCPDWRMFTRGSIQRRMVAQN